MHTRIIKSDILKGLEQIEPKTVDLIFIDPPYNLNKKYANNIGDKWKNQDEYLNWVFKWLEIAIDKLKDTGSLYIMNSTENMPHIDIYLQKFMHIKSRIIWGYDSSGVQAKNYYGSLYEPILFAVKNKKKYTFNSQDILIETITGSKRKLIDYRKKEPKMYNTHKVPGNIWYFPRVRYKMSEYVDHPSQKPEKLLERIILASTNKNDLVLDLFAGTFSLGLVCLKYQRNYIGIEKSSLYVKNGEKRLKLEISSQM